MTHRFFLFIFSSLLSMQAISQSIENSHTTNGPFHETSLYNDGWELKDTTEIFGRFMIKKPVKGKGIVFKYLRYFDLPGVNDEEYTEVITWHIPEGNYQFEIQLDTVSQINYYFSNNWLGAESNAKSMTGTIKGVKQNEEWFITGSLVITRPNHRGEPQKIDFSKTFIKAGYTGNDLGKILRSDAEPFYLENRKDFHLPARSKRTGN